MRPIFETDRLVARELTLEDLDFVASVLANPEVMRHYPRCSTRDEARESILRQLENYAEHGYGRWLISERAGGRPVGLVGLLPQRVEGFKGPEIAYMIDQPFWRRGFATEAASASRDYAFETLGVPKVISLIRPVNLASQGVARRIGMSPGPTIVHAELEHIVFSIDRDRREG